MRHELKGWNFLLVLSVFIHTLIVEPKTMNHEPTKLESALAAHTLKGFALLVKHIDEKPEVAFVIAQELNNIHDSIKESKELSQVSKKRLMVIFNKIGVPILEKLKARMDEMDNGLGGIDPTLN